MEPVILECVPVTSLVEHNNMAFDQRHQYPWLGHIDVERRTRGDAWRGDALHFGRGIKVVARQPVWPGGIAEGHYGPERNHVAGLVAGLQPSNIVGLHPKAILGLCEDLVCAA